MMWLLRCVLFLVVLSCGGGAIASPLPHVVQGENVAKFDFRGINVAQVVQLIYSEALRDAYVIDPEVLNDPRSVSFRYDGSGSDLRSFVRAFFDSLGLEVVRRNGVDFVGRKKEAEQKRAELEPYVYRPRFRDGSYLVELLGPLFSGSFTSKRTVRGSLVGSGADATGTTGGNNRTVPAGSAAATVDRQTDVLVFNGTAVEIGRLKKILPQVDTAPGDVLVRGALYEVQTSKSDGSAFSLAVNVLGGKFAFGTGGNLGPNDTFASIKTGNIDAVLAVLATDSRFKAVSKPMLRVTSEGSGRFTVGQDVPVLGAVTYPGNGAAPVQSVSYQSSGVIYDVRPVLHDVGIELGVMQQISNFVATDTGVSGSPTLIKRELRSDLNLTDGEIVVMGGLTDSKDTGSSSGPSFLPSFMRGRSSQQTNTEILLVLQVTKL